MDICFPSDEFSIEAYRLNNLDLARFRSDQQLAQHYDQHGKDEGRIATDISNRHQFLSLLSGRKSLLEIGVFDSPSLNFLAVSDEAPVIHYADFLSREDLVARAERINLSGGSRNPQNVPDIRWTLSDGYEQIDIKYDAVVSHHCVEHQPDLISHFIDIRSILGAGGWYLFSVPNKSNCFDHFIPVSTIVDILNSYYTGCKSPSFRSVLEHRVFTSHSYHDGINPYDSVDPSMRERFQKAFEEYCTHEYVDVHCWQFTPDSLRKILQQLAAFELIPAIDHLRIYPAVGEFYVAIAFA